jgi:hypothetical protein
MMQDKFDLLCHGAALDTAATLAGLKLDVA